jgi:hypothetical protein
MWERAVVWARRSPEKMRARVRVVRRAERAER